VSSQLALNLYASSPNAKVGILDVDLTGPSIPRMFGVDDKSVHQSTVGWVPVYADGSSARLACMSVGFLLKNKGDSVVWRGPKKNGMIRQFLSDVRWGELDYLVIDTPPGEFLSRLNEISRTLTAFYACRHLRRASFPHGTPRGSPFAVICRNCNYTSSRGAHGRDEMPLVYESRKPPRAGAYREHEWIRLPMLRRNKQRVLDRRWRRDGTKRRAAISWKSACGHGSSLAVGWRQGG